jgi:hypothetical protein
MNGNQDTQSNLVDTTDYLEAVGVCRCWKNFLFIIIIICLLLLQISFWLVDTGYVKAESFGSAQDRAVEIASSKSLSTLDKPVITPLEEEKVVASEQNETEQPIGETEKIEKAAEKVVAKEPANKKEKAGLSQQSRLFGIKMKHLNWVIWFCNFIIILAAILYCLVLLLCFKVSLIGRLGGINHICRAFFISLVMVILLLPWQNYFGQAVSGAIYTPDELVKWCTAENMDIFDMIFHYLRFTGYWLLILLLLIFTQLRSSRWTKAILRRLEVL